MEYRLGKTHFPFLSSESTERSLISTWIITRNRHKSSFGFFLMPFLSRSFSQIAFENCYLFEACPNKKVDANYALAALSFCSKVAIHCAPNAWELQQWSVNCWVLQSTQDPLLQLRHHLGHPPYLDLRAPSRPRTEHFLGEGDSWL